MRQYHIIWNPQRSPGNVLFVSVSPPPNLLSLICLTISFFVLCKGSTVLEAEQRRSTFIFPLTTGKLFILMFSQIIFWLLNEFGNDILITLAIDPCRQLFACRISYLPLSQKLSTKKPLCLLPPCLLKLWSSLQSLIQQISSVIRVPFEISFQKLSRTECSCDLQMLGLQPFEINKENGCIQIDSKDKVG